MSQNCTCNSICHLDCHDPNCTCSIHMPAVPDIKEPWNKGGYNSIYLPYAPIMETEPPLGKDEYVVPSKGKDIELELTEEEKDEDEKYLIATNPNPDQRPSCRY
jgi:hypothetical protein